MGPKVKMLVGQLANTLVSGSWDRVLADSVASAAECFHTEGPRETVRLCPQPSFEKNCYSKSIHINVLVPSFSGLANTVL